jgi:hypothetical protein
MRHRERSGLVGMTQWRGGRMRASALPFAKNAKELAPRRVMAPLRAWGFWICDPRLAPWAAICCPSRGCSCGAARAVKLRARFFGPR